MFGDVAMTDKGVFTADPKSRILLLKSAHAEPGEKLVVVDCKKYYELISKDVLVKALKNLYGDPYSLENLMNYGLKTKKSEAIDNIVDMIVKEVTVDPQGRVVLGGILEPGKKYRVVGVLDRIRIYELDAKTR